MDKGRWAWAMAAWVACGGSDESSPTVTITEQGGAQQAGASGQTGQAGQVGQAGQGGMAGTGGGVGLSGSSGQTSGAGGAGASSGGSGAGAGGSAAGGSAAGAGGQASAGEGGGGAGGQGGGTEKPLRFAIIGDFGVDSGSEAVVAEMVKAATPEFVITLGDNNYPDGKASTIDEKIGQYYAEFIAPYKGAHGPGAAENRFFPSPGNHDWNTDTLDPYLDYFELPGNERYYDFVRGPVHFFVIDSDGHEPDGNKATSVQGKWLQQGLAASTSPFRVVYFHHPPFTSGLHGNSTTMQWPFAAWGASAVLSGHDHTYERLTVDGIPYIVNGLGGAGLYQFVSTQEGSVVRYNKSHGAMFAEATSEHLIFRARSVEGTLIDEVVLLPEGAPPPPSLTLVAQGSSWRYLDDGTTPAGWQSTGFDDASWKQGQAPLGYGDPGLATTIDAGPPGDKHITSYFRASFTAPAAPLSLTCSLRRDDGAVVYLNGKEAARSNLPAGTITGTTLAASTVNDADETTLFEFSLDPSLLVAGPNVVAVEVHQSSATSSDVVFDLQLSAALP